VDDAVSHLPELVYGLVKAGRKLESSQHVSEAATLPVPNILVAGDDRTCLAFDLSRQRNESSFWRHRGLGKNGFDAIFM
jgi:hypothetical protein